MPDRPYDGRILIEWARVTEDPTDEFDWRITLDPNGLLTDDEMSRLLKEISERI